MGIVLCWKRPTPPPKTEIVGDWVLNEKSKGFRLGNERFRFKKGTNLLGTGLHFKHKDSAVCRLIVHEDGMIEFYEYTPE